ncbi:MAG: Asp-tRNA(Asn)/Glu-tRNA(Gln) amidotransferase subunit GatC [Gammaproteobacteria bacterium]|nr:Asp-tRNA(Asn)/Glu-tRNA(Gln) amidotransferase subunit GatC [Gammaproteobacteria bacterium]
MSLDNTEVKRIAHLARLAIDEEDIPNYAHNLTNILDMVEQMGTVNTDNVTPMAHPLDTLQRLRDDEPSESNKRDHFQKISPAVENGLFLVPKVIE